MDRKIRAIVREMKRHLSEMRRRGHLKRQLALFRLTTTDLVIRKGRRT